MPQPLDYFDEMAELDRERAFRKTCGKIALFFCLAFVLTGFVWVWGSYR